jgi:hypothetical protein
MNDASEDNIYRCSEECRGDEDEEGLHDEGAEGPEVVVGEDTACEADDFDFVGGVSM